MTSRVPLDMGRIEAFCRKWGIREFSLFGSVLTDEFRPDSDVDVLAVYDEDSRTDLFGHMHAEQELAEMFGRKVDLVMKDAVKNPFRRRHILDRREIVYAR